MKVSVIMAAYNAEQFVAEGIESVLCQTYENIELIVIDDGSTDGTAKIVKRFTDDQRLQLLQQENQGQAAAKNTGVEHAVGAFIAFCDADDFWLPTKLEKQIPLFAESPRVGVVFSDTQRISESGERISNSNVVAPSGVVTNELLVSNFVPFGTAVIRQEFLKSDRPFDERYRMGIDWELWLRLSLLCEFSYLPIKTYFYRVWDGQMSSNWRGRYEYSFKIMNEFLRVNPTVVGPKTIALARADSYANRAKYRLAEGGDFSGVITDWSRALRYSPFSYRIWRVILRSAMGHAVNKVRSRYRRKNVSNRYVGKAELSLGRMVRKSAGVFVKPLTAHIPRILMYHRIVDGADHNGITRENFERQMHFLAQNFDVQTVGEILNSKKSVPRFGKPRVALTFDDGYQDFLTNALPILSKYAFRATLYVTSKFADGEMWHWPDKILYAVLEALMGRYEVETPSGQLTFELADKYSRRRVWSNFADCLVYKSNKERAHFIDKFARSICVSIPGAPPAQYAPMTWGDLKTLASSGYEIGGHSATHDFLSSLTEIDLLKEVSASKQELEEKIGVRVDSFAYPNGKQQDHSETVVEAVREAGYKSAVVSYPNPASVGRLEQGRWSVSNSFDDFRNVLNGLNYTILALQSRQPK